MVANFSATKKGGLNGPPLMCVREYITYDYARFNGGAVLDFVLTLLFCVCY
jgi:hypothetical protein